MLWETIILNTKLKGKILNDTIFTYYNNSNRNMGKRFFEIKRRRKMKVVRTKNEAGKI